MRATDPSVAEAQSWRRLPARTPQRSMKSGTRGSRRSGTVFGGTAHGLRCALSLGAALRAHALIQPACSLRFSFSGTQPRAVAPKLALRVRSGLGAHGQVDAAGVKSGPGQVQNTVLNEVGAVEGAHTPVPLAGSTAANALVTRITLAAEQAAAVSQASSMPTLVPQTAPQTHKRRAGGVWRKALPLAGMIMLLTAVICSSASQAVGGFLWLYREYEKAALAFPIVTKSATSGIAYFLGDSIAQAQAQKPADYGRLVRATLAGFISHGPQLHFWTLFLEWSALPLLVKVLLDQTLFALYLNGAYAVLTETLQGRSPRSALAKAKAAALPCLFAGWRFWPLAHLITYTVIPLHLRVLWVDVLEVAWVRLHADDG